MGGSRPPRNSLGSNKDLIPKPSKSGGTASIGDSKPSSSGNSFKYPSADQPSLAAIGAIGSAHKEDNDHHSSKGSSQGYGNNGKGKSKHTKGQNTAGGKSNPFFK